jgi:hypothetical protein
VEYRHRFAARSREHGEHRHPARRQHLGLQEIAWHRVFCDRSRRQVTDQLIALRPRQRRRGNAYSAVAHDDETHVVAGDGFELRRERVVDPEPHTRPTDLQRRAHRHQDRLIDFPVLFGQQRIARFDAGRHDRGRVEQRRRIRRRRHDLAVGAIDHRIGRAHARSVIAQRRLQRRRVARGDRFAEREVAREDVDRGCELPVTRTEIGAQHAARDRQAVNSPRLRICVCLQQNGRDGDRLADEHEEEGRGQDLDA